MTVPQTGLQISEILTGTVAQIDKNLHFGAEKLNQL